MNPNTPTRLAVLLFALLALPTLLWAQPTRLQQAARHDTSPPLLEMITAGQATPQNGPPYAIPNKFTKFGDPENQAEGTGTPGAQAAFGTLATASVLADWEGTSDDDNAAVLGFRIVPPDTEGDVGPNHYVQWSNLVAEIFDKSGNSLTGPFDGSDFFNGFGGICETTNDGDPIVLYDPLADRWMVSQFAVPNPFAICMAVSTGPDPTGTYHRYEFPFGSDFPDYFKVGVWDDAYYITTRNFASGSFFTGVQAVAVERPQMLNGNAAQMVVFNVPGGTQNDGWLPADYDGAAGDFPTGTPGLFAGAPSTSGPTNEIELWAFDVDWGNTSNSTFTQLTALTGNAVDISIFNVPQPAPGENLDVLADFLMHRMPFRDFGTHQSMLINHTADVGSNRAGIRWYELRNSGGGWSIHQQGTYAPADGNHRWMGSIAMNGSGDIALGFSRSGTDAGDEPSIYFTGQTADQSGTGTMNVAETLITQGTGVQQSSSGRWGDYSMMAVDPSDDATFWFTTEYYATTGSFDFTTRIAHFALTTGPPNDVPVVTITAPADGSNFADGDVINFTGTANDTEDGDLSASLAWTSSLDGALGTGASINTALSIGTHTVTASATDSGSQTGSDQISVTVNAPPAADLHVENITTGTQSASKGKKNATASVLIHDENGNPVAGVTVTGNFSGTITETGISASTDAAGVAFLVTNGSAKSKNFSADFCVSDVTGGLPYDPADNANPAYDCGGGTGTATDVHVSNITTGSQGVGGGNKAGTATVTIQTDLNGAAAGYTVTGTFSGDFNESASGVTGSGGTVSFQTTGSLKGKVNVSFCVDDVVGALPYDSADNASTAYDCATAAPAGKQAADAETPVTFALEQNAPNPFNPSTQIAFVLPAASEVSLRVYNMLGQEVAVLVEGYREAGRHAVRFDASRMSSGIYLYVVQAEGYTATRRMTLLK